MAVQSLSTIARKDHLTRQVEPAVSGAVQQHGQWLEQAVLLDLLLVLDRPASDSVTARWVNSEILATCRRLRAKSPTQPFSKRRLHRDMQVFRRDLLRVINRMSEAVLNRALAALNAAKTANVRYEVEGPFGPRGKPGITEFEYDDIVFGDPDWAFQAMVELRKERPEVQCHAMQFMQATLDKQSSGFSMWNEDVPLKIRESRVRKADAKLLKAEMTFSAVLQPQVDAILYGMQCAGDDAVPLAMALPFDASNTVLQQAALCYRKLSQSMHSNLTQNPVGAESECELARQAWASYRGCAKAFHVVAAWLSALSATASTARCEFCYRHRVTRRRCHEHTVPESVTRDARLGRVLAEVFVSRVEVLTRRLQAHVTQTQFSEIRGPSLRIMIARAERWGVPSSLHRHAAILANQLRALWSTLGEQQSQEVQALFLAMLDVVKVAHQQKGRTLQEQDQLKAQRARSPDFLSLRGFLRLWHGRGRPFSPMNLEGRGHDPAHPQLHSSWTAAEVARSFLMRRAWLEVKEEHAVGTMVDRERAVALRAEGNSLRQIARLLGCSHEKVRQILVACDHQQGKRAVLRPYAVRIRASA